MRFNRENIRDTADAGVLPGRPEGHARVVLDAITGAGIVAPVEHVLRPEVKLDRRGEKEVYAPEAIWTEKQ